MRRPHPPPAAQRTCANETRKNQRPVPDLATIVLGENPPPPSSLAVRTEGYSVAVCTYDTSLLGSVTELKSHSHIVLLGIMTCNNEVKD